MPSNQMAIKRYFKTRPITKENLLDCIRLLYEYRNYKVQNILSSSYLQKIVNEVLKVMKVNSTLKTSINNNLFDLFMSYRLKSNATVAHAPTVDPVKLRAAIRFLFYEQKSARGSFFSLAKIVRHKITALHALLCSVSGRRWIDVSRIRWESVKILKARDRTKFKFSIPGSKANPKGKRNEGLSLVQDFSDLCPVALIIQYWILMGRPKFGFVFPCIHRDVSYVTDCVDTWELF